MSSKSELWWVSVGGSKCEPAQVVTEKLPGSGGQQPIVTVFTIGCTDGTVDPRLNGITLVQKIDDEDRPLTPAAKKARETLWEKRRAEERAAGIHHSYRRFD